MLIFISRFILLIEYNKMNLISTTFDLSTFSTNFSFNLLGTLDQNNHLLAHRNDPLGFEHSEIDHYLNEELRYPTSHQFYNHEAAYKILEASQRILMRWYVEKWRKAQEMLKQQRQEKLMLGFVKLNYVVNKKVQLLRMKCWVQIQRIAKMKHKWLGKFRKLEDLLSCIFQKYYSQNHKRESLNQLIRYTNQLPFAFQMKLKRTIKVCQQQRRMWAMSQIKSHGKRVQTLNIFVDALSFIVRKSLRHCFEAIQDCSSSQHEVENECYDVELFRNANMQSLSPIVNKDCSDFTIKEIEKEEETCLSRKFITEQANTNNPSSSKFFRKIGSHVSYKNIDTSISLTESTFFKPSCLSQPVKLVQKSFICTPEHKHLSFPRQQGVISGGEFVLNPLSVPLFHKRPDQQYQTLNDQIDTNPIFNFKCKATTLSDLPYKNLKNSISQYTLRGMNSPRSKMAQNLVNMPTKSSCLNLRIANPSQHRPTRLSTCTPTITQQTRSLKFQKSLNQLPTYKQCKDSIVSHTNSKLRKQQKHDFLHRLIDSKREQLQAQIRVQNRHQCYTNSRAQLNRVSSLKLLPQHTQMPY